MSWTYWTDAENKCTENCLFTEQCCAPEGQNGTEKEKSTCNVKQEDRIKPDRFIV